MSKQKSCKIFEIVYTFLHPRPILYLLLNHIFPTEQKINKYFLKKFRLFKIFLN